MAWAFFSFVFEGLVVPVMIFENTTFHAFLCPFGNQSASIYNERVNAKYSQAPNAGLLHFNSPIYFSIFNKTAHTQRSVKSGNVETGRLKIRKRKSHQVINIVHRLLINLSDYLLFPSIIH
ncbi:hypothetical protein DWW10_04170 [Bacteroides intestinalis]|uniref:Uncharacterized protein n=1 Tax=Bacteroides intestinalis TaxID=329854 RepID=A0A412YIJ4_9BACE|nr:hypothetical protein DWW10_04170 [Bacteroides intestinalis]RHA61663.1 hypothetical protein DW932_05570 [Bacteroides intestinalis]